MVVVGEGNVGVHARRWLTSLGYEVHAVSARAVLGTPATAAAPGEHPEDAWRDAGVCGGWVLCRDTQIPAIAEALVQRGWPSPAPLLHGAGAVGSRDERGLAAAAAAGVPVGTLHPVQALRSDLVRDGLGACHFGVEGDDAARALIDRLVPGARQLDLTGLSRAGRLRYHAACALVANHLGVLLKLGTQSLTSLGLPEAEAVAALGSLLQSSEETLRRLGFPAGVTGPASRGDLDTVGRHLETLDPLTRRVYATLSDTLTSLLQGQTPDEDPDESSPARG